MNKQDLHVGYCIETFPKLSENFIAREVAGVRSVWPGIKVYAFNPNPTDYAFVDCGEELRSIPVRAIRRSIPQSLLIHAKWFFKSPLRYLKCLNFSRRLYKRTLIWGIERFHRGIMLANVAAPDRITHLHAHFLAQPAAACWVASRMMGITFSVSAHAKDVWARSINPGVIEGATCCVMCNEEAFGRMQTQFPGKPIHLLPHWIPSLSRKQVEQSRNRRPGPMLKILSAGRFVGKKGFDDLIFACSYLKQQKIAFECEIYGDGELEQSLKDLVERLELGAMVVVKPSIPHEQLLERMRQTDLFIMASRVDPSGDREGVPNVVLEAISCGAIVLTTHIPSLRGLLKHRQSAYFFPAENPPEMARTVVTALGDTEQWQAIRECAYDAIAANYEMQTNLEKFHKAVEASIA